MFRIDDDAMVHLGSWELGALLHLFLACETLAPLSHVFIMQHFCLGMGANAIRTDFFFVLFSGVTLCKGVLRKQIASALFMCVTSFVFRMVINCCALFFFHAMTNKHHSL